MAARRIRAARPLAPHGLPGHLVGFVEALRGSGISVGPSETVDAGRVMATLGLGDREVLREGIACAVLRRPDHRDTYDAMFDLWFPAALGARAVITTEDESAGSGGLPPDDVEAMRQLLLDLLANNQDLAGKDERLVEMIARIVEAYGKYSSSRGPSFSSYQALKAMALSGRRSAMFRRDDVAALSRRYVAECLAVARAEGARLDDDVVDEVVRLVRSAPQDMGTSMLADRAAHRPLEWDLRNGVIVRKARAHGLATPISDVLVPLLAAASDGPG